MPSDRPGYPRIARPGQKPGPLRGLQRCIRVRTGAIWRFTSALSGLGSVRPRGSPRAAPWAMIKRPFGSRGRGDVAYPVRRVVRAAPARRDKPGDRAFRQPALAPTGHSRPPHQPRSAGLRRAALIAGRSGRAVRPPGLSRSLQGCIRVWTGANWRFRSSQCGGGLQRPAGVPGQPAGLRSREQATGTSRGREPPGFPVRRVPCRAGVDPPWAAGRYSAPSAAASDSSAAAAASPEVSSSASSGPSSSRAARTRTTTSSLSELEETGAPA